MATVAPEIPIVITTDKRGGAAISRLMGERLPVNHPDPPLILFPFGDDPKATHGYLITCALNGGLP